MPFPRDPASKQSSLPRDFQKSPVLVTPSLVESNVPISTPRRVLHAADIHLDSPLQKLDAYDHAPVDEIRNASRRALENLVNFGIEQQVDLVVIAGDLYDGDWTDQNTGLFFVGQASRLVNAGIHLAIIRGNHDAANRMTSSLPLPKNPDGSSIMFDEKKVDRRVFEKAGIVVHGRSYRRRAEIDNLALEYPARLSGLFNLGLLHTSLMGNAAHETYAPCTKQELLDKDYDYWALGHVHQRTVIQEPGSVPIVFSGNIQGRHIREEGAKGCVLLDIDVKNQCKMTFVPLDVLRWEVCSINVATIQNEDDLLDRFQTWMTQQLAIMDLRLLIARVRLDGTTPAHAQWIRRTSATESALRAASIDHGHGQVWLESFRVRTTMLSPTEPLTQDLDMTVDQGPLHSVDRIMNRWLNSDRLSEQLELEFETLLKKLPPEFRTQQELIDWNDPAELRRCVEAAGAEVLARLKDA